MSVLTLVATQIAGGWELRACIETAENRFIETACDNNPCSDLSHMIPGEAWHANCIQ